MISGDCAGGDSWAENRRQVRVALEQHEEGLRLGLLVAQATPGSGGLAPLALHVSTAAGGSAQPVGLSGLFCPWPALASL